MSKNIENTSIEELPTSQLILYMTNPELTDLYNKIKIESVVFDRLTNNYKYIL